MKTKSFQKFLVVIGIMTMIFGYSIQASAISFTYPEQCRLPGSFWTSFPVITLRPLDDIQWYQLRQQGTIGSPTRVIQYIAWGRSNNAGPFAGIESMG